MKTLKGFHSRPTTDFAKEGLFNILEHGMELNGIRVLDVFAGTGSMSFEFLSRGAEPVFSVELNQKAAKFIRDTSTELKIPKETHTIVKMDALKFMNRTEEQFDLVFADPPFDYDNYSELIEICKKRRLLVKDGIFILEHHTKSEMKNYPGFQKSKTFGNVCFTFFNFDTYEE